MRKVTRSIGVLPKSPSGIRGLDEITNGGSPRGRPTLVCGAAGCGKTLLAMESLVHGAREYGENGVFMAFEEAGADLAKNVASLGFDVDALIAAGKLLIDHVHIERSESERRANMTSRAISSGSTTPLRRSEQNASRSIYTHRMNNERSRS